MARRMCKNQNVLVWSIHLLEISVQLHTFHKKKLRHPSPSSHQNFQWPFMQLHYVMFKNRTGVFYRVLDPIKHVL